MRKILLIFILSAAIAIFYIGINTISDDYYNFNTGDCNKRYSKKEYLKRLRQNLDDFSLETSRLGATESIAQVDHIVDDLMEHIDYIICMHGEKRLDHLEKRIDNELERYKVIFKQYFESRISDDRHLQKIYFRQLEDLGIRLDQYILDYENEISLD